MGDPSQQYGAEAAEVYDESADWPVRRWAEFPTFLAALGPVTGEQVLDLACGTGIVTRLVAGQGAAHVLGVESVCKARARVDDGPCDIGRPWSGWSRQQFADCHESVSGIRHGCHQPVQLVHEARVRRRPAVMNEHDTAGRRQARATRRGSVRNAM
jgi:hypothetical protein